MMDGRVYQGRPKELPENYHGTAFSRKTIEEGCEEKSEKAPCAECAVCGGRAESMEEEAACPASAPCVPKKEEAACPCGRGEEELFSELLLLVICALMMESDAPDTKLLALMLLLLLSPTESAR